MTNKRVVYQNDQGGVSVICPNYEGGFTINDAIKAVPSGKPYAIVDQDDIPSNRSERMSWTVDESDLTDGVGS